MLVRDYSDHELSSWERHKMRKLKGILQIIAAIGLAVFLVVGWDFLGNYYLTLRFLPTVPLFGARLVIIVVVFALIVSGVGDLRAEPESSDAVSIYE
jgi:hypothetical protein